jgi:hypothetical protein
LAKLYCDCGGLGEFWCDACWFKGLADEASKAQESVEAFYQERLKNASGRGVE